MLNSFNSRLTWNSWLMHRLMILQYNTNSRPSLLVAFCVGPLVLTKENTHSIFYKRESVCRRSTVVLAFIFILFEYCFDRRNRVQCFIHFFYLFFCRLRSENVVVETVLENVKLSNLEQPELLIFFASSQLWWFADSEIFLRKVCPYFPKPKCHHANQSEKTNWGQTWYQYGNIFGDSFMWRDVTWRLWEILILWMYWFGQLFFEEVRGGCK